MLCLLRSLQHTSSPIWRLGFSTVSLDIATCCSVLVHSQRFQFLLQTLNRRGVFRGHPRAPEQNPVETNCSRKSRPERLAGGQGGPSPPVGSCCWGQRAAKGTRAEKSGSRPQAGEGSLHHHPSLLRTERSRAATPMATSSLGPLLAPLQLPWPTTATRPPVPRVHEGARRSAQPPAPCSPLAPLLRSPAAMGPCSPRDQGSFARGGRNSSPTAPGAAVGSGPTRRPCAPEPHAPPRHGVRDALHEQTGASKGPGPGCGVAPALLLCRGAKGRARPGTLCLQRPTKRTT